MPALTNMETPQAPLIDILIPCIEKDLDTLPIVIDHIRKYVHHPIGNIYIVSPASSRIQDLCSRKHCVFINERSVLPITKQDIHYASTRWNRSGWLYQQLLKLNGDKIVKARYFLVMDADTVLIKPHSFIKQGKTVFYCRDWSQPEYFNTYRRLMGKKAARPRSFVTHYMLFDKTRLSAMKKKIEADHQLPWYRAIISSINKKKQFGFSEYETYANYLYALNPAGVILKSANNKSLHMKASALKERQIRSYSLKYRSLSFHQRKIYSKSPRS